MKTADEIINKLFYPNAGWRYDMPELTAAIKQIQNDALSHAAEIVTSRIGSTFSMVSVRNEILNEIKP